MTDKERRLAGLRLEFEERLELWGWALRDGPAAAEWHRREAWEVLMRASWAGAGGRVAGQDGADGVGRVWNAALVWVDRVPGAEALDYWRNVLEPVLDLYFGKRG